MADQAVLAIDCGIHSLRVLLFSDKDVLIGRSQIESTPYVSSQTGWAEQYPEIYWNSLCLAYKDLKQQHPEPFKSIAGIGVTSQRGTMTNVEAHGTPPIFKWGKPDQFKHPNQVFFP